MQETFFTYFIYPPNKTMRKDYYYAHYTDEEIGA